MIVRLTTTNTMITLSPSNAWTYHASPAVQWRAFHWSWQKQIVRRGSKPVRVWLIPTRTNSPCFHSSCQFITKRKKIVHTLFPSPWRIAVLTGLAGWIIFWQSELRAFTRGDQAWKPGLRIRTECTRIQPSRNNRTQISEKQDPGPTLWKTIRTRPNQSP